MTALRRHGLRRPLHRGVTLIELMIALAVVSILIATALPSYRDYGRRAVRSEAQAYLISAQVRQQQFLVDTRAFATTVADLGIPIPARVSAAYDLSLVVVAGPPSTYTLAATPKDDQVTEACGILSVRQDGAKTAAKSGCW
jgi:type IV pilus assembly protein PilE